jgi:hypothetical protein
MDNEHEEMMDQLILSGALEPAGIDMETGELLYNFTPKLKEVSPMLYQEHVAHVNGELMRLWENGFLNINMTENNPIVRLTSKAFDEVEISKLSKEDRWGIEEIKRILRSKNSDIM